MRPWQGIRAISMRVVARRALSSAERFELYFDGGSRGNPGHSGSGALIDHVNAGGARVRRWEMWHYLDAHATNNVAEYSGLLLGLNAAVSIIAPSLAAPLKRGDDAPDLAVRGDSMLAVRQISGRYAVQATHLRGLRDEGRRLLRVWGLHPNTGAATLDHVLRDENAAADALANVAMDERTSGERTFDARGTLLSEVTIPSGGGVDAVLLRCGAPDDSARAEAAAAADAETIIMY